MPTRTARTATHLWLTENADACALLAEQPAAFVIGFQLDQQVSVLKAFRGPLDLQGRVGSIDPAFLAALPLAQLEAAFAEQPALHRYPSVMAGRVQAAMRLVVDRYDGDAGRIWWEAGDLDDLRRRLRDLPGIGAHTVRTMVAVLARRCEVPVSGWEHDIPEWGTLADVTSLDQLLDYQMRKQAAKRALRATKVAAAPAPG